eukprot:2104739-Ditylum_brightwellii.AAC.2
MKGLVVKFSQVLIVGIFNLSTLGTVQVFHEELLCRQVGFAKDGYEGVLTCLDIFCQCSALIGVCFSNACEATASHRVMKLKPVIPSMYLMTDTVYVQVAVIVELPMRSAFKMEQTQLSVDFEIIYVEKVGNSMIIDGESSARSNGDITSRCCTCLAPEMQLHVPVWDECFHKVNDAR